ncbi:MAG: hypothetical protein JWL82_431 [Parcubacteria group bacterium]|nr:hypothetical protein [Parcubacteria group bacterium]
MRRSTPYFINRLPGFAILVAMARFVHGLDLNRAFYYEVVEPLMKEQFPNLKYSAGLVGHGSDVMGFDSPTSIDHDWGPRLDMFFSDVDYVNHKNEVDKMLRTKLPTSFKGYPTHFVEGDRYRKHQPKLKKRGPVNHLFSFFTTRSYFQHYLGFDIDRKPTIRDWLLFPQQALIEITGGQLFRDDLTIQEVRDRFAYYPDDIWKYMMQSQWAKIIDEFQMQARTGEEGDDLGSRISTARTLHNIMFMCFLIERKYVPYAKWRGKAFVEWLKCGKELYPRLMKILDEPKWKKRQEMLAEVYQILGNMHNDLRIMEPMPTKIIEYFGRGYPVIDAWKIFFGFEKAIRNPKLLSMKYPIGSVDQFIDHVRINHMDYVYWELKDAIQ